MKWFKRCLPVLGLLGLFGLWLVAKDAVLAWLMPAAPTQAAAACPQPMVGIESDIVHQLVLPKLDAALAEVAAVRREVSELARARREAAATAAAAKVWQPVVVKTGR